MWEACRLCCGTCTTCSMRFEVLDTTLRRQGVSRGAASSTDGGDSEQPPRPWQLRSTRPRRSSDRGIAARSHSEILCHRLSAYRRYPRFSRWQRPPRVEIVPPPRRCASRTTLRPPTLRARPVGEIRLARPRITPVSKARTQVWWVPSRRPAAPTRRAERRLRMKGPASRREEFPIADWR